MAQVSDEELARLEELLDKIKPDKETFINNRINHQNFAKVVVWLSYQSMTKDFIFSRELSQFLKMSNARIFQILGELCSVGIMRKVLASGNLAQFFFVKENDEAIICKYLQRAERIVNLN